jgi:hypothetical protein
MPQPRITWKTPPISAHNFETLAELSLNRVWFKVSFQSEYDTCHLIFIKKGPARILTIVGGVVS